MPTVHTIFLQCSREGSILNTGSMSVCVYVCVCIRVCVWVGVGGVIDCGPTDHRKPQEIEVRGGGGGSLWSGQTWSNMSRYLSANISLPLRVLNDDIQRRKCRGFLRSRRATSRQIFSLVSSNIPRDAYVNEGVKTWQREILRH